MKSIGIVARTVVMAELMMDTPTDEIDTATRLTCIDAPDKNCTSKDATIIYILH